MIKAPGQRRPSCHAALLLATLILSSQHAGAQAPKFADPQMPLIRIDVNGFDASEADIRAIVTSAGRELWRFFPDYTIEPIVVTRGREGPVSLYQRNDTKEIVLRLDTSKTLWSQYSYQFSHEFCHVLCGYDQDDSGNLWFEETLCETASLFAMRAMARSWKTDPPYSNWKDYRDALRNYTDQVIAKRTNIEEIHGKGLAAFYQKHQATLRKTSTERDLNGAMSIVLLHLFERQPTHWEAVRWLNSTPSPAGETFEQYLKKWHGAVPQRHQEFVKKIAELYGQKVD
ncbi:MAG: hypothetical protein VB877_19505 [Pirellulaceae bacterium]